VVILNVRYPDGSSRRFRFETTFTFGTSKTSGVMLDIPGVDAEVLTINVADPDVTIGKCAFRFGAVYLNDWSVDADFVHVLHVGDQLRFAGHLALFELVAGTPLEVRRYFGEEPRDPDTAETELLVAMREEPESGEAREVYADWLDVKGRCSEAEFVRLQWLSKQRKVLDPEAFSSEWMSHQTRAVQLRLRDLAQLSDPERRALVSRPTVLCSSVTCERRWDALPTDPESDLVRACKACNKDVEFCSTIEQLAAAGRRRRPAAVDPIVVPEIAHEAWHYPNRDFDEPTNPLLPPYVAPDD
jgi:uncharacterized protein (TIGR02996 family)